MCRVCALVVLRRICLINDSVLEDVDEALKHCVGAYGALAALCSCFWLDAPLAAFCRVLMR